MLNVHKPNIPQKGVQVFTGNRPKFQVAPYPPTPAPKCLKSKKKRFFFQASNQKKTSHRNMYRKLALPFSDSTDGVIDSCEDLSKV